MTTNIADKVLAVLKESVFAFDSTDVLFNPYKGITRELDKPNADKIRQKNLKAYVESCFRDRMGIQFMIVGEAPGPHGCRFSGVPFTNEFQLLEGHLGFTGQQSSNRNEPYHAPASNSFWKVMSPFLKQGKSFFVWNCVPFHPHKKGDPLSVRNPTSKEINDCSRGLLGLIEVIQPSKIIAVGRKAELALSLIKLNTSIHPVRHPSRGGSKKFEVQIKTIFS